MMNEQGPNIAITKIDNCIKTLTLAIKGFQEFLGDKTSSDSKTYYQSHQYFEEGKAFYQEALNEISKLLGSLPENATPGFRKWKESFLKGMGIISESKEFEALKSDLQNDDFLLRFLTPEEINFLFVKHYESQQTGKRKIPNIKARLILDKIKNLMSESETLYIKSKEKLYQLR